MASLRSALTVTGRPAWRFALVAAAAVVALGVFHASLLHWVCDDIFITLRTIDNWFDGHGIVYNAGERVEAYTHPLWLLLLSAAKLLGTDMIGASIAIGLAAFGATLALLAFASWTMAGRSAAALPVAAAAVAVHHDAAVWATGGLETSLFTFFVTASAIVFGLSSGKGRRWLALCGALALLSLLSRPDGVVVFVTLAGLVALRDWSAGMPRREMRKRLSAFAAPAAVLVPYAVWKLGYYGDLFPNTYYAKSGGGSYFSHGWVYISSYLSGYPSTVLLLLPVAALGTVLLRSRPLRERVAALFGQPATALAVTALTVALVYAIGFVARVGGDFMYARFLIPVVPLVYLSVEAALRTFFHSRPVVLLVAALALPALVLTVDVAARTNAFGRAENGDLVLKGDHAGIIDERWYWNRPLGPDGVSLIEMLSDVGRTAGNYFEGLDVGLLIRGQACLAYTARAPYVLENWGLTDPVVARMPIAGRGRIGHEKEAPMDYILSRRVHFFFYRFYTPQDTAHYRIARFDLPHGWEEVEMHFYDRDLMRELRRRFPDQIRFVDFEAYLDDYLARSADRSRQEMETDFAAFRAFYFFHNADAEREKKFLEALVQKGR